MKYYLGLDNGGTTTKAALFDAKGSEICVTSEETAAITPRPGFVERDMDAMWQANCDVIQKLLAKSKVSAKDIAAVGICGHGKGLYLWGKDDKPTRNGIISSDNRACEYVTNWQNDGTEAKVFEHSCQHIMACQPVALLAWLKDHEPEAFSNIKWIFSCKDYVRFCLTGKPGSEYTDCSGSNFMNLHTRTHDKALMELFGLGGLFEALPPLCAATDVFGGVTKQAAQKCGLLEGTPVIGGMFDIDACALAVNVTDEQHICMIAGTWSINEYLRKTPVLDGSVKMNSLFCLPEYYLIEESSATSAGNNEWFIKKLLPELAAAEKAEGRSLYDTINKWVEEISPDTFVPVFLPFIMASNVHPDAKGSFVGICANHDRRHLLRSVYEGVAFCHRWHLEKLLATRDTPPKSIRLAGGAARSKVWTQMFADVMQLPVETVEANETGALGCAIAAAYATGEYSSLSEAAGAMSRTSPAAQPNPSLKAIYDEKYALYVKAIDCLDGLWTQMQALCR